MCGHVDHSEKDLTKPIISFSLGQTAIFLMGGETLNISPIPVFVRSGDIIIMAGESRKKLSWRTSYFNKYNTRLFNKRY